MNFETLWSQLNQQHPSSNHLENLLNIGQDLQDQFYKKFCHILKTQEGEEENEWAMIHWPMFARLYEPEKYVIPIFHAMKSIVQYQEDDDYLDTYIYNALACFLEDEIGPQHEQFLIEEWAKVDQDDFEWRETLLGYLAKAKSNHSEIIQEMVKAWEVDVVTASSFLYDHPHPKLMAVAESYIQFFAPWNKYIWSKNTNSNFAKMDWVEVTSAWVKAKFPEEDLKFDLRMSALEAIHNRIGHETKTKFSEEELIKLSNQHTKWREEKIKEHFESRLPDDWKDWIFSGGISPEARKDFQNDLIDAGLFQFASISKNGPCSCGSGKKAKRCCYQ